MITYKTDNELDLDAVIDLYRGATLGERRPIDDRERMSAMLKNANLPTPPPARQQELVHQYQSTVGKDAPGAVVVDVALAGVVFRVQLIFKPNPGPLSQQRTQNSAPKNPHKPKAEIPVAGFTVLTP